MKPLAIHGGKPVRDRYLPYGRQSINEKDIEAVTNVLTSDFLTTGPAIDQFEQAIANYVGAQYAVSFSNGTAALHAACFAAGIEEGDEVITSPLTFVASSNAALYQGAKVKFADVDLQTFNLDPQSVEKLITDQTKAIIAVDFAGQPCNYEAFQKLAYEYDLTLIEDAAHAIGASYKGRSVGSISDLTMFSFHPVKQMTTGEGGVITTNDAELYRKLLRFRTHGVTRDRKQLLTDEGPWYYEMHELGYNYRLTDMQAALGLSQLKRLNQFIDRRQTIAERYNKAFESLSTVTLPFVSPNVKSSWHLYVIQLNESQLTTDRKTIFEALQKENIGVNVHYIPVYWQPYYQQLGYRKGICPNAERLYQSFITLPLFPSMTDDDVSDVIQAVEKVLKYYEVGDMT
ncbi:UDP-4-amino-4,6-dideoxy-N-acetyl-beta-L-altrosamine transaminase [Alkalibacillus filiformis]|uniref:UDP-4-amino-4, 6-dideoxy-N-acetyl-beta-L-altrosamine transaminase n=1 Tax=Alkalibacillus filiformis TaxID=200990 RepID=A0ABU0DP56_9BACI|nr:UDP-4-amino-4,6-dideoxy-N-acetyl-beta-L-altrosamine transaminase [Alkalibacillus filiformis]MDQ0350237.1 UDP-4-amino-4,6-dideoxy-N-acetyl-beta-L-altrosamine transaminase [Alkalibacillus filiformis]